MDHPNYQQDSDTFDQVNAAKSHRSRLELEQLARDIVEDRALLVCVLKTAAQILDTMAPEEGDPAEETERAQSPPPVSPPRVESQTSQPYQHSPYPSPRHHHQPPLFPLQGKENVTEEAMEQQTTTHGTSGQTTPRQSTWGHPTICGSPVEDFSAVHPTASETAAGQSTPEQTVSGKFKTGQPRFRQPIPGQAIPGHAISEQPRPGQPRPEHTIPGLFTPDQPTTAPFSQGQYTPGQYVTYQQLPGHWSPYHPTPGQGTPSQPKFGQYTTFQGPYSQHPIGYPTRHQYSARRPPRNPRPAPQPPPVPESEQEREARELAEYIDHGHDEELKEKYPEHFMRRGVDGRWESR